MKLFPNFMKNQLEQSFSEGEIERALLDELLKLPSADIETVIRLKAEIADKIQNNN